MEINIVDQNVPRVDNKSIFFILWTCLFFCSLISCKKENEMNQMENRGNVYDFMRNENTTVINNGQVVRNLLLQDLSIVLGKLQSEEAEPIEYQDLYVYYDNGSVTIPGISMTVLNGEALTPTLSGISGGRDLAFRVNPEYKSEIEERVKKSCTTISENSKDPNLLGSKEVLIDGNTGIHLGAYLNLTLLGGVLLSHGLNTYLIGVENKDNVNMVVIGNDVYPYTEMEHHFNEVFGYLGASRVFDSYTLEQIADPDLMLNYKDNFVSDGKIDFKTEYNYTFCRLAAQRDLASGGQTHFAKDLYTAFFLGRQAIINNNLPELKIQKEKILISYEQLIGANAIHHLNQLLAVLQNTLLIDENQLALSWTQSLGFIEMFRYNYNNSIANWQELIDDNLYDPKTLMSLIDRDMHQTSLENCRNNIAEQLNFTDLDFQTW